MYPLKQGLKPVFRTLQIVQYPVFTHVSIKTRIETSLAVASGGSLAVVFTHVSIKTRIETKSMCYKRLATQLVFTHVSIKTRIETGKLQIESGPGDRSLPMYPLKQGLKHVNRNVLER